ncbi:hypothetical protein, partial [[Clostridium] scindens]|uniref:hypothetical protein n=1 Tax=Clostridium scindens (strain JCM 10418 / VPI 12708) TaxID=29347 RepID=UPI003AB964DD
SIHVPIAGNDVLADAEEPAEEGFQSTFPLQGTTLFRGMCLMILYIFQSTFPLQGTTANLSNF